MFSQENTQEMTKTAVYPYSFFERAARTKAESTITKSIMPIMINGILKAGSE